MDLESLIKAIFTVKLPSLFIKPLVPSRGSTNQYGPTGCKISGLKVSSEIMGRSGVIALNDFKIILLAKLSALVTGDPSSLISVSKESESYTSIITFEASITVSFKDGRILLMKSWSMIMLKLRF